jgi:DNA polymerase III delta subunit
MKVPFSERAVPTFEAAPSAVLITGDVEFFVEEAAAAAAEKLAGEDAELLPFDDEAPTESVSDALLNRSLFSARRVVWFDITRLLGSDSPGSLVSEAVEAWGRGGPGGKREAFRKTRALLSALALSASGDPDDLAVGIAKKVRRKEDTAVLAEILRDLPDEKGGPAMLREAVRTTLARPNDGTVALMTAVAPPRDAELLQEIESRGLVLSVETGGRAEEALSRLARARAKEREVALDPAAVARLIARTDARPQAFASELSKLLDWAGPGGRIRAADVQENVEDEASEDLYALYDAIGRRDAADVLTRVVIIIV